MKSTCWLFVVASAVACLAAPQATIGKTTLSGAAQPFGVEFFGAIPFAQPPVGKLRFSSPVLVTKLEGATFDASKFGPPCIQLPVQPGMSEDCLTVNVFRPAGVTAGAKLPVMTWVYGGGFIEGMASLYNATLIVAESISRGTPIVFVTLNYRLGPWGWPTGSEALKLGATNLGLKDQVAALKWVQANVGNFGGDKSKVTLFGESAGAISIANLFLNSNLESLIRAAIFESGSQATTPLFTAQDGTALWRTFAKAVPECANADPNHTFGCLRSASVQDLLTAVVIASEQAPQEFAFVPVVDGDVIPAFPSRLLAEGRFAKVPFISGTNLDEGTDFTPKTINSTDDLKAFLDNATSTIGVNSKFLPGEAAVIDRLLELYPDDPALGSPFNTGTNVFGASAEWKRGAAILGDVGFQGQRRLWINAAADRGVKTFGYLFTDPQPGNSNGVSHGSEVLYVFGETQLTGPATAGFLSSLMIDYWVSFATSLNPNDGHGNKRPTWPQYTPSNKVLIQLNSQNLTTIPDNYREKQIEFINQAPIQLRHKRQL